MGAAPDRYPWQATARERWAPRPGHVESLRVRAWLGGPVAVDALDGLTLEGALAWAAVLVASGELPDDACAGADPSDAVEVQLPLEEITLAGRRIACSSVAVWPESSREAVRRKRKRPHPGAMRLPGGRGIVATQGGQYKALDLPVMVRMSPVVDWYVRADRERLEELLRAVHGIGRWRNAGVGIVHAWEVTPDPEDRSLVWRGHPARPLPVESEERALELYPHAEVTVCATRAPYWHRASRCLCAVP